jgi:predicted membrane channel-forming protein YqfA (hemolysin III family)
MGLHRRLWEYALPTGFALLNGLLMFLIPWKRISPVFLILYVLWGVAGIISVTIAAKQVANSYDD